jgi:hypothetical protein
MQAALDLRVAPHVPLENTPPRAQCRAHHVQRQHSALLVLHRALLVNQENSHQEVHRIAVLVQLDITLLRAWLRALSVLPAPTLLTLALLCAQRVPVASMLE